MQLAAAVAYFGCAEDGARHYLFENSFRCLGPSAKNVHGVLVRSVVDSEDAAQLLAVNRGSVFS